MEETEAQNERFESWAVVEVMGHSTYAGMVREQSIGGSSFVRIDVPAVGDRPAFTKLFGQGAIYCITPCTKEVAENVAANTYCRPVQVYTHPSLPQIEHSSDEDDDGRCS